MIPSTRLLVLWGSWCGIGVLSAFFGHVTSWAMVSVLGIALCGWDALRVSRHPKFYLERHAPQVWPQARWTEYRLELAHAGTHAWELQIFDHIPAGWEQTQFPQTMRLAPQHTSTLHVRLRCSQRGDHEFHPAHVRIASPWKLWEQQRILGPQQTVRVFPDLHRLMGQELLGTDQKAPSAGMLRRRRRGSGTEFHQLREYRRGDSLRTIDWNATSRMHKLISREYHEERDQQVVFLLDTGRRMLARDGQFSHFDHVLMSILRLSWVAQKQGDAVGLLSFGHDSRWLPPYKGQKGLDRLLSGLYDLQPGEAAPDYLFAAQELTQRLHRRALVVLATNLRDEDNDNLHDALFLLQKKHLVICANLQESILPETLAQPVRDFPSALRHCATQQYLADRQQALQKLGLPRRMLVDATPQHLPAQLVNRYLDIKESALL